MRRGTSGEQRHVRGCGRGCTRAAAVALAAGAAIVLAVSAAAADVPPANTSPPTVGGTPQVGQTLTADPGTWSGTTPITYGYQWRRCGVGYRASVLADQPLSYWRLGERSGTTAVDERGGPSGTYQNGVLLGRPGALPGDPDTAVALDGANDTIAFPARGLAGPFAIELWGYLGGSGSTGQSTYATLVGYDTNHRLLWKTGGGRLRATFDGAFSSTNAVSDNAWHHIVYSFDGATERWYVDGAPNGSHATTVPTWRNAFLAGAYDGTAAMLNGRLDELALYDKALTAAQVARHYGAAASTCTDIAGATNATYSAVDADAGAALRVSVTASNSAGSAAALSAPTAAVAPAAAAAPANLSPPTIAGVAAVGQTLTADPGTWSGTAPITYGYQWRRCTTACADIAGATAKTYVAASADAGATLRVNVTASNSAGSAAALSAATATIAAPAASAPANTGPPTITGTAVVGQTLSADPGTWSGTTPITYGYQWRRCGVGYRSVVLADQPLSYWRLGESAGTTAVDERGAAAGTYQNGVVLGRAGAFAADPNTAVSLDGANDSIAFPARGLTGPFAIELWAFLAGPGTSGATSYATLVGFDFTHRLLWQANGGLLLAQFDGNFFSTSPVSANAWHHIVYSFDGGAERWYVDGVANGSHATTMPTWANAFLAGAYDGSNYMFNGRLDELAVYGKALTASQAAQHYAAAGGGACADIAGATAQTYTATDGDAGATLRVAVTASNSAGSATALSAPTAAVGVTGATAPTNTSPPTISGTAQVGQTLTADAGTWSGTTPITYGYQWRRCAAACADIAGAGAKTYVVVAADAGATLRVNVTASNSAGSGTALSAATPTVTTTTTGGPPSNTSPPTISGTPQVGETLTAATGTWSGTSLTYAYQWRRCGAAYRSVVLADQPLSYWRLGETAGTAAVSETGAGGGTYVGGPALGQSGAIGVDPDRAVGLDGVDDVVSMPSANVTGPFTIELWAFLAGDGSTGATGYATLAGYDFGHRILWQTTGGGRLLAQFDGNFFSTTGASLNAWHHIAYTYDGQRERFYIDGVPAGEHATVVPTWRNAFYLGSYDRANYLFKGRIDDAALYPAALTPTQLARHYDAGLAAGCRDIVGATGATHRVVPVDRDATLDVAVTATSSDGSSTARSAPTAAVAPAPAPANPIRTENALPGSTAWVGPDATNRAIEGYASTVSAAPGDQVTFHVSTSPVASYRIEIFRLGWYGGAGARLVACLPGCSTDEPGVARSIPAPDPTTGKVDAAWPVTDTVTVGSSWVSGYYLARLVLTSGTQKGAGSPVFFIVRAPSTRAAPILVHAPVNTWQAYNSWGGKSLYAGGSTDGRAAVKVSFNRPGVGQSPLLWEYPALRFLEREGYDVSYATNLDAERDPAALRNHRVVMSLGHDEYWTRPMRAAWEAARDAGVDSVFLGGNNVYWQARYEDAGRTLVVYRDAASDPEPDPSLKTVRWRDLATPEPECRLLGIQTQGGIRAAGDPPRDYTVVDASLGDPWFTDAEFAPGARLADLVGYEWEAVQAGCAVPPLTTLLHYTGSPSNADSTRYRAASGARVYSSGSIQFSWGLDGWGGHDAPPDARLQQFVRNALDDLTAS